MAVPDLEDPLSAQATQESRLMQPCLINQSACGRVEGNPVCPKCGMDERVVYPGQSDREAAQTAGKAQYWEAHACELERHAKEAGQVKAQTPPPVPPPPAPSPQPQPVPTESPPTPPAKSGGFNWAWVPMVVALLGVSAYFKIQKDQDQRRIEEIGRMVAQMNTPSTAERILGGGSPEAAPAARQPFEPEMVPIPAGSFTMGSPESEPERQSDEGPQRKVSVGAFELGKTEVTFAQWDACLADGGCSHRPDDQGWGRGNNPVINVSWDDITQQFIPWLNLKSGKQFRLPTEAEWEYAARAGCATPFNVGGSCRRNIQPIEANFNGSATYNGSNKGAYLVRAAKVGSYQANNWGLYDIHGNVSEWIQDCKSANYKGAPIDGREWTADGCGRRVVRGGSWLEGPMNLRTAYRLWGTPDYRNDFVGFRLARTVS